MTALKSALVAGLLVAGLAGPTQAQRPPAPVVIGGGAASYPGPGSNHDYYAINGGFGNYGLPGRYPFYNGYGLSGYGPGSNLGGYFTPYRANKNARGSNNMGGVMDTTRQQAGKSGERRGRPTVGVSGVRRGR